MRTFAVDGKNLLLVVPASGLMLLIGILIFNLPAFAQPGFKKVPEFQSVKDLDGKIFNRQSLKGKHTLIVFFSIYGEDTSELLAFAESASSDSDVNVISVNIDPAVEEVKRFIQESAVVHPAIIDQTLKMSGAFKIRKVPTVFLIGPDLGVIYATENFGADEKRALLSEIQNVSGAGEAGGEGGGLSKKFNKKFLLSPDATTAKFQAGERQLVLYISGDSVLWVYDPVNDERYSIASKVESAEWAPTGARVVFSQKDKPGLWWKELKAESAVRIAPFGSRPAWSPDGAFIAFFVRENEIWVYNIEKKKRWRLPVNGDSVSWSGDGKLLLIRGGGKMFLTSPWAKMSLLKSLGN